MIQVDGSSSMSIGEFIAAVGALGAASCGVVEGLKWTGLGEAGFPALWKLLAPLQGNLAVAYGSEAERVLRGQYRGDQRELARLLRQGVRAGLTSQTAAAAAALGANDTSLLSTAVGIAEAGQELSADQRNAIGRFELAADARIDAALALGQNQYAGACRVMAAVFAFLIAILTAAYLTVKGAVGIGSIPFAMLVALVAVPVAPITKDLTSALSAVTSLLRRK